MHELDDIIQHYGVKGMKWGVRKSRSYSKGMKFTDRYRLKRITSSEARKKYIDDKDSKWLSKVSNDVNISKVAKRTAKDMRKINKELKKEYGSNLKRKFNAKLDSAYNKAVKDAYKEALDNNTYSVYKNSPSRTREVEITPMPDGTLKAKVVERNTQKLNAQRNAISKAANKRKRRDEARARREAERTIKQSALTESMDNVNGMYFLILPDDDGFPMDVIQPFDDQLNHNDTKDTIQHFGVKGMRWGVRKDRGSGGNSKVTIRERAGSLKRERQWSKVLKEADNMTNEQLNAVAKRVGLENDLKRLVKESRMATKSDKADYTRRKDMDDTELMERVNRLRAKDNLSKRVREASKEQRELGEKVVNVGSNIALKYVSNKPVTGKDIFDAIVNPDKEAKKKLDNRIRDEAVKRIVDSVTKNSR